MKKILFFAAVTALAFTACTNDDNFEQNAQKAEVEQRGVGFDVYVPQATTRSGRANVMTTGIMQETGFGIYGYQTDNAGYSEGIIPNYMWNQQVNWNQEATGWYYAPLKYWPNETKNDSQEPGTSPNPAQMSYIGGSSIDKLSFFAYAPWVKADEGTGATSVINNKLEAPAETGIKRITASNGHNSENSPSVLSPAIKYIVATNPDYSVDLLWGVAPMGGLTYQSVASKLNDGSNISNGTVTINEGMPLVDLIKPAVNTNLKLLFQHSLARLGVKVVAAVDQVSEGGVFDYGNSKITIDEIRIIGEFGTEGVLTLKNTEAFKANWAITKHANTNANALTIKAGQGLAPHLIYDKYYNTGTVGAEQQRVTGVTTTVADAIKVNSLYDAKYSSDAATLETTPKYSAIRPYFKSADMIQNTQSGAAMSYAFNPTYSSFSSSKFPTYATYTDWAPTSGITYFHKVTTNKGVAYTDISSTINTKYPTATVWENIETINSEYICKVVTNDVTPSANEVKIKNTSSCVAYRKVGNTYTATGQPAQLGDYVFYRTSYGPQTTSPLSAPANTATNYYKAKPNYFMIIPTQAMGTSSDTNDRRLQVFIRYYVSTQDASLQNNIVYTKNEVEKYITLPHLKNGVSYDLKLILGLTSVKLEAEVSDWTTTGAEVNLPQNTNE